MPDIEKPLVTRRVYTGSPSHFRCISRIVSDGPSRVATMDDPSAAYGAAMRVKYVRAMRPCGKSASEAASAAPAMARLGGPRAGRREWRRRRRLPTRRATAYAIARPRRTRLRRRRAAAARRWRREGRTCCPRCSTAPRIRLSACSSRRRGSSAAPVNVKSAPETIDAGTVSAHASQTVRCHSAICAPDVELKTRVRRHHAETGRERERGERGATRPATARATSTRSGRRVPIDASTTASIAVAASVVDSTYMVRKRNHTTSRPSSVAPERKDAASSSAAPRGRSDGPTSCGARVLDSCGMMSPRLHQPGRSPREQAERGGDPRASGDTDRRNQQQVRRRALRPPHRACSSRTPSRAPCRSRAQPDRERRSTAASLRPSRWRESPGRRTRR